MKGILRIGILMALVLSVSGPSTALALNGYHWQHDPATAGDWFVPANWGGSLPYTWEAGIVDNGGTVQVSSGSTSPCSLFLGYTQGGAGLQTGGQWNLDDLYLGRTATGPGQFTLNNGTLSVYYEEVAEAGPGTFIQNGGSHIATALLISCVGLGNGFGQGLYDLRGGTLTVGTTTGGTVQIGGNGRGTLRQWGGTLECRNAFYLGSLTNDAVYELHDGTLNSSTSGQTGWDYSFHVGFGTSSGGSSPAVGYYSQFGGTHHCYGDFYIGTQGLNAKGVASQTGGTLQVDGTLYCGYGGTGTLTFGGTSAASLNKLVVDSQTTTGTLGILSSSANVTVRSQLQLGSKAILNAVDGAAIHLAGASFDNQSKLEANLADLARLSLIAEGGTGNWMTFETACKDQGRSASGFDANFALGNLVVGENGSALVRLVDDRDNGNRGGAAGQQEALYLHNLTVAQGSTLDLNGLHVYYDGAFLDQGGAVLNGTPIQVPEPATLSLMALGGLAAIARRREARRL